MSTKNYRGRFEGEGGNIDMVAEGRKKMDIGRYNKFWIAIVGVVFQVVASYTGFNPAILGITPEVVIGIITAIGVFAIPNKKPHVGY